MYKATHVDVRRGIKSDEIEFSSERERLSSERKICANPSHHTSHLLPRLFHLLASTSMAPLEPKPPDLHHLAPPFIPCCLFCSSLSEYNRIHIQKPCIESGSQDVGNRLESWVFVAAQFHEDSGMVILDSTVSSLKSMSSVSIRSTGDLKDIKF